MWDMEERHMRDRHQLAEQLLKNKFTLKRSLMMQRHSKVIFLMKLLLISIVTIIIIIITISIMAWKIL